MNCSVCAADLPDGSSVCSSCGANLGDPSFPTVAAKVLHVASSKAFHFAPGDAFGERYTVVEEVGIGGMGCVYKAIDRELEKTVALKLILPEVAARVGAFSRFKRELALAQEVTHPNVSRVYDLGEVQGLRYISMEYVAGQSLRDLIKAVGRLSARQTLQLGRQICAGLQAIHTESIVHRDLKPSNIVIERSGRAVLMDFGIAQRREPSTAPAPGEVSGTPAYFAPEQAQSGFTDHRSDIYALGLILFEMLTGKRPPADGDSRPLALRPPPQACPPPSRISRDVPAALDAIVLRCLESEPSRRFQSAAELDAALQQTEATLSSDQRSPTYSIGRRRAWLALAAAAALALAAGIFLWGRRSGAPTVPAEKITLACLPLAYDGPENNAYFSQLIPLLVSEKLRTAPSLLVAPFASSRSFQPQEETTSAASQLEVSWLLRGLIRVRDSSFEVELVLLPRQGNVAWTRTIRGRVEDILSGIDRVASNIASRLGVELAGDKSALTQRDARALERFLEGKKYLESRDIQDPARATSAFSRAVELDPEFAEAHAGLAQALWTSYFGTRDPSLVERAATSARRALDLMPSLPEAHLARGIIELGRGHSVEARESFQRAQRLAPADDAVCRRIAEAYYLLGRHADAERLYRRAIELRPSYWENYNQTAYFYLQTGNFEQAERNYRKVIRLRPESDVGYSNLAATLILSGQSQEAKPLLQAAIRINPTADSYINLGFVHYSGGSYDLAVESWQKAIDLAPEEPTSYTNLGDAYRHLGQSAQAQSAYGRAIELNRARLEVNPKDQEARLSMAISMAGLDRCREADQHAAAVIAEQPENPTYHYYAALIYAVCNQRRAALTHTAQAIQGGAVGDVRSNPDLQPLLSDPTIRDLLDRALATSGQAGADRKVARTQLDE